MSESLGFVTDTTEVLVADAETGRSLLGEPDEFVLAQGHFDRISRLNLPAEALPVDADLEAMYLGYVRAQVMPWSPEEIALLGGKKGIIAAVREMFDRWSFRLPEKVYLVKTTGQEEGHAAYTRHTNVIVLPSNMVNSLLTTSGYGDPLHPAHSGEYLRGVIVHEFFHLISKNNRDEVRSQLYPQVAYHPISPVALPKANWPCPESPREMKDMQITNPDSVGIDVRIDMRVEEGSDEECSLTPILMSDEEYRHGPFFQSLKWYFMEITENGDDVWVPVLDGDGRPVTHLMDPAVDPFLWKEYLSLIDANAKGELFHPEEIIAQEFATVAALPSPKLLTDIDDTMRSLNPPAQAVSG